MYAASNQARADVWLHATPDRRVVRDGRVPDFWFTECVMARIRSIKPEFPQSESIGKLSRDARLLFVMLWTICDDYGRSRASSRMLANLLFPYDDDARDLVDGWLNELEHQNCIIRYQIDDQNYLEVCNWLKHQRIDHPGKPQFPSPREDSRKSREDSRKSRLGREGKGRDRKGKDPCSTDVEPGAFESKFWPAYPRKVAKASAAKAFAKINPDDALLTRMLAALAVHVASEQWRRDDGRYIPHPATWLNQRRWEDEAESAAAFDPASCADGAVL
ncbi:MAG: hypothetical protein KGL35_18440 [Bradyrhizobium sp.]|nr:hypothetical protein [Bradyrhizobium sp.]